MARIGEMACVNPRCSCQDVAVNETAAGTYSATCHKCGASWFAKRGTRWRRDVDAGLLRLDAPEPGAAPAAIAPAASSSSSPSPVPPAPSAPRRSVGLLPL